MLDGAKMSEYDEMKEEEALAELTKVSTAARMAKIRTQNFDLNSKFVRKDNHDNGGKYRALLRQDTRDIKGVGGGNKAAEMKKKGSSKKIMSSKKKTKGVKRKQSESSVK